MQELAVQIMHAAPMGPRLSRVGSPNSTSADWHRKGHLYARHNMGYPQSFTFGLSHRQDMHYLWSWFIGMTLPLGWRIRRVYVSGTLQPEAICSRKMAAC